MQLKMTNVLRSKYGERIYVPVRAEYNIEHEREGNEEELNFKLSGVTSFSIASRFQNHVFSSLSTFHLY